MNAPPVNAAAERHPPVSPFTQLRAANLLLQTRAAALRPQVIRRVKARRAALRPVLDMAPLLSAAGALGSGVKTALRALVRTWHEPPRLTAYLRPPAPDGANTGGMRSAKISTARRDS